MQVIASMSELISVAEAEALIARHMPSFGCERVALDDAAGRILREPIHAERDQPPFDRVMMDGIAIAANGGSRRRFLHSGLQLAGMAQQTLGGADTCMETTTGAMLPRGCDTIVPVEQTQRDGEYYVLAEGYVPTVGQFVHPRGSDCHMGDVLLEPGVRLHGPEIAVLAANGISEVAVAVVPSVTIVATGDELVGVDQPLLEGQIRGSNDRALAAALRARGFEDVQLARVVDDLAATITILAGLLQTRQVLVLSGGVSVGQRDYVPKALRSLGVHQVLHRIAQRPGKPMWFGIGPQGQVVFALPGNPVSALVCAARYLLPALQSATGLVAEPPMQVCLESTVNSSAALTFFVPVHVHHDPAGRAMAAPLPPGTSGDFSALPRTHGFVELSSGLASTPAGTVAAFYRW
jgi:molybdopterin molybdotransferase